MLYYLDIKNAALIEHLTMEFDKGMTVLTGETGAGKSVIVDSINMIMGARTDKKIVRYGEKKASVQAIFSVDDASFLEEYGLPYDDNNIVIQREVTEDGKSVCRVNGAIAAQNVVREVTGRLINIHGQHDSQDLLVQSKHINFLDAYAKCEDLLEKYQALYNEKKRIEAEISGLEMDEAEKIRKIDLLEYQINEIQKANIKPGEKESLKEQRILIQNGEKISMSLNGAYGLLYDEENSAYDKISKAVDYISKISDIDENFKKVYEKLCDMQYNLQDLSHEIYSLISGVNYDEGTLNEIEERLDIITRLIKKYGNSEEGILEFLKTAEDELLKITDCESQKEELIKKSEKITREISIAGEELSKARKKAAENLSAEIVNELFDLDMPRVRFLVSVEPLGEFGKMGIDKVEFLISPNAGEPLKELKNIASGGEMSRIMLAIKSILSDSDKVDTMIFDEIDTGVSGSAAQKIAQKLFRLGEKKQVICVSHQPQLASAADNHFNIKKAEYDERTLISATLLDREQREREIARMTDGDNITNASLEHARELLGQYKRG